VQGCAHGRTVIQGIPCPSAEPAAAVPPPPPPLACRLDTAVVQRAVREERQFLARHADEASHRRAEVADLDAVADRIRVAQARFHQLVEQRQPLEKERAFYENDKVTKPLPPWLRTGLDASDAQFLALADILRGLEQDVGSTQARYQCERERFGMMWGDAAPGSSACHPPPCAHP